MRIFTTSRWLAAHAVATSLLAQGVAPPEEPRGLLAGIPLAICRLGNGGTLLLKPVGDQSVPPAPFGSAPASGVPVFTAQAMFGELAPLVDLDAISTGNDRIPMNANFVIEPRTVAAGGHGWINVAFSVTPNTTASNNGAISRRAAAIGNPGADLYSVFFYSTATFPVLGEQTSELVDRATFEFGHEHCGMPSATPEIVAMDMYLPYIAQGHSNATLPGILVANPASPTGAILCDFYFSVTSVSADLLNAHGQDWTPSQRALSGADVFKMSWNGAAWSAPSVFKSYGDLGLSGADDIMNLAVDHQQGGATVFMTQDGDRTLRAHKGDATGVLRNLDGSTLRLVRAGDVDAIGSYD